MTMYRKAFFLVALLGLVFSATAANAAPCRGNGWQPTFVHDLQYKDGPWYVNSDGRFTHLRIRNRAWVAHACAKIRQNGVRNRRGYTNCRQYTRIQCGCRRGYSESNSTCRSFLGTHTKKYPIKKY